MDVHRTIGRTDDGRVTCRIYDDGDVVVVHGWRGNVENMREVSGHGPILNMCDRLDVPDEFEFEILDFVYENNEIIDGN